MRNTLIRTRRARMRTMIFCALFGSTGMLFGQSRDFNTERLILDDDAGDGTRNTLTLQTPVTGLTGNWTLIFPNAGGFMLTSAAAIEENQILFGNSSGQVDQNPDLTWDDANSIFGIADGAFTVDGVNDVTEVGGDLLVTGAISDPLGDLTIDDNLVPSADDTYSFGTDATRWSDVYVNGGSVHVGEADGEANDLEITIGFVGIVGEINNLGGDAELIFNGDALELQMDGDGDGTIDAAVNGAGIRVNTGAGVNAVYAEDGVSRDNAVDQTFAFTNSLGDIDVSIDGDLDVTGSLTAGTLNLSFTQGSVIFADATGNLAENNSNLFWDNTNGRLGIGTNVLDDALDVVGDIHATGTLQSGASIVIDGTTPGSHSITTSGAEDLTIAPGGGDLAVTGNTNVTGSLDVDTDLNVDGNTVHVGTLDQQGAVSNSTGDVVVSDDANVTGSLDVDTDLNADGVTTLGGATAVTNSRLVVDDGHWTSQQTTAPSAAVAGANVTSVTLSNETDVAGFIDITTSGTPAAGAQATVTFDAAYNTAPIVVMMAANGPAAGVGAYVSRTTTGFTVNFIGVPAASTSHQFFYQVIETQ